MSLDDFLKAGNAFIEGTRQLAVTGALSNATEQINQLNTQLAGQVLDEKDRTNFLQQVSNNLVMDLMASGANASQIQTVAGQFGLDAAQRNAAANQDRTFVEGQRQFDDEMAFKWASLKAKKEAAKGDTKTGFKVAEQLNKSQSAFNSKADKSIQAYESAKSAINILESGNPIGDNTLPTFFARATGEVGNLTEAERKPFGSVMSIKSRLAQITKQHTEGKLTDENRRWLKKLAGTMMQNSRRTALTMRDQMANQAAARLKVAGQEMDLNDIRKSIYDPDASGPEVQPKLGPPPTMGLDLKNFIRPREVK